MVGKDKSTLGVSLIDDRLELSVSREGLRRGRNGRSEADDLHMDPASSIFNRRDNQDSKIVGIHVVDGVGVGLGSEGATEGVVVADDEGIEAVSEGPINDYVNSQ